MGRSAHAAACLNYGGECPQIFITGGNPLDGTVLRDTLILDVQSGMWKEVIDIC